MKTVMSILLMSLMFAGCHSNAMNHLTGSPDPKSESTVENFYTVSCCQDNDGKNNLSWPSFVPQAHRDFCAKVELANSNNQTIDGKLYLAMHVDCGHGLHSIGDQYYPSTGY